MDGRAAKLALARKKLKDHQEKKQHDNTGPKDEYKAPKADQENFYPQNNEPTNHGSSITRPQQVTENICKNVTELTSYEDNIINNIPETGPNTTEILISSKRILEQQVNSLQTKLLDIENVLMSTTQKYDDSCQRISTLEGELKNHTFEFRAVTEQLTLKDAKIKELNDLNSSHLNEMATLQEQLEFTKSILAAKEAENGSLQCKLLNLQSELDSTRLQLQQLTSGGYTQQAQDHAATMKNENDILIQKVSHLEQQLKIQIKDYQQLNSHYEHYVGELNDQLKEVMKKNEQMSKTIQDLENRENSLVDQISDMEIRLQNYKKVEPIKVTEQLDVSNSPAFKQLQESYGQAQQHLHDLSSKYDDLQKLYAESKAEIEQLMHSKEIDSEKATENVSLLKLNADITSDKIAAQRATEQNKKLKQDIHDLEDAFVKMTKDKLELTEKLTAEKFLNRELTIKLAEIDEKANDMQRTLKAKDEEMMRLQTSYRIIEEKYNEIAQHLTHLDGKPDSDERSHSEAGNENEHEQEINLPAAECDGHTLNHEAESEHGDEHALDSCKNSKGRSATPRDDAMVKLQERFLKIMDEVADLSDEKHRLEHIITQLQNETDTICEYVALYQQQRCLLKKRDEERSAQMKMFQSECNRLQSQLNELTGILTRFAEDTQLSAYFQVQTKHEDIQKVMKLLSKLKTNSLIDPNKSMQFNDFYPCSCCSGQLIEV